jgi:hypothetical protein
MPTARTTRARAGNRTGSERRTTTSRRKPDGSKHVRPRAGQTSHLSHVLVDHDEIRRWAEERGGSPAAVKGTPRGGDDVGMIRIDFPGYSGEGKLEPIDWEDWFGKFDESSLALIVQDRTAGGEISHFNKLVSRGTIEEQEQQRGKRQPGTSERSTRGHRAGASKSGRRSGQRSGGRAARLSGGRRARRGGSGRQG